MGIIPLKQTTKPDDKVFLSVSVSVSSECLGSQHTLLSRLRVSDKSVNEDLDLVLLFYWPLQQLHQYSRVLLKLAACFDVVRRKPTLFLLLYPVLFHYHLTNLHVPPFSFCPLSLPTKKAKTSCFPPALWDSGDSSCDNTLIYPVLMGDKPCHPMITHSFFLSSQDNKMLSHYKGKTGWKG